MSKQKVLFVIHSLSIGGAQKSLIEALNAIDYNKNDVTLFVWKKQLDLLPFVNKNVVVIVNDDNTRYYRKPSIVFKLVFSRISRCMHVNNKKWEDKIVKAIIRLKLNYAYNHFFKNNNQYTIAISYISMWHCIFIASFITAQKKICFHFGSIDEDKKIHKEVFDKYNLLVADSNGTAQMLRNEYKELQKNILVLHNYVDNEKIIKKAHERIEINRSHRIIIASCGRLSKVKGFDLAVRAAQIMEKKIDFIWYFVGDGEERKRIESLIEKYHLEHRIIITGLLQNPYPYIYNCDIYVQPSYEESYGITINEAKVLCKPIVSTKTAGGLEQLENWENGLLVEKTGESIAQGIITLVEDIKLRDRLISELKTIDYSDRRKQYMQKWEELLG